MNIRIHRRKAGEAHGKNPAKSRAFASAGLIAYMLLLLMRLLLPKEIGEAGVGLFAPALELLLLADIIFSGSVAKTVSGMIRYRIKREQYGNAHRVFRAAFWMSFLFGAVMAALLIVCAGVIAQKLCLEEFSRLALMAAAPAVMLAALIGAFRGCFSGFGLGKMVVYSQYLEKSLMAVLAIVCGKAFYSYGTKIATLLRWDVYTYLYSALGAMTGMLLAELITFLFLVVVYGLYAGTIRRMSAQENGKRRESMGVLFQTIFLSCIPSAIMTVMPNLLFLIDQRMFNYGMNRSGLGESRTALWGSCYGRIFALLGLTAAVVCVSMQGYVALIAAACEREEYHMMRERVDKAVCKLGIAVYPAAVYLAVLADAAAKLLFPKDAAFVAEGIRVGAFVIVVFCFSFLLGQLIMRLRLYREGVIVTLVSFLVHLPAAYVMLQIGQMGAQGVILSFTVYYVVYAVLAYVLLNRYKRCRIDWLHSAAFPAVAAGVSGLLVLLLNRLLLDSAGAFITIAVGVLLGVIVDVVLLMALRVVTEEELSKTWYGIFFITLGRQLRIF